MPQRKGLFQNGLLGHLDQRRAPEELLEPQYQETDRLLVRHMETSNLSPIVR